MNKVKKNLKNNIFEFPKKINVGEKEVEAIVFAAAEPLDIDTIQGKISKKTDVEKILLKLQSEYSERGINLVCISKKWSFRTSPKLSNLMTQEKTIEKKLSRAAIETLSIIAYQQPITRSEIENIRGVQMGRGSIDHLMEIGWIKPSGRKNIPGKPALWVTTELFMEHFGIEKISDLPNKDELKASGFLEKRSAIATITDIAGKNDLIEDQDIEEEETLDDFIPCLLYTSPSPRDGLLSRMPSSA